jgi:hypothetical protein
LLELMDIAGVDEHLGSAACHQRTAAIRDGTDPARSGIDALVVGLADI